MRKRRNDDNDDTEVNITPMLDIVFIMLIFFIVTTSFVKETGISPKKPFAETSVSKPRANILIGIDLEGRIWMNSREVQLTHVRQLIEDALTETPESSAVLIADQESPTGVLIDVMDQVRLGGVFEIAVSAEPEAQ